MFVFDEVVNILECATGIGTILMMFVDICSSDTLIIEIDTFWNFLERKLDPGSPSS